MHTPGLNFNPDVAEGGYIWWYVDAISEDGRHALTIIAFIGSVFSPYYAWKGYKVPRNHVAINVALYSRHKCRWAMTERSEKDLNAETHRFQVKDSSYEWDGEGLTISFDEVTAPIPERIRGTVRLTAPVYLNDRHDLDAAGRHRWGPIAPHADVKVELDKPSLNWSGHGYFDTNEGDEPLHKAFARWDWSRAETAEGALILYNMQMQDGSRRAKALAYDAQGHCEDRPALPEVKLPRPFWGMERRTQTDEGQPPKLVQTVEDGPFYVRSILETPIFGERVMAMHESVDLNKHNSPITRLVLPWRMPRGWWFG